MTEMPGFPFNELIHKIQNTNQYVPLFHLFSHSVMFTGHANVIMRPESMVCLALVSRDALYLIQHNLSLALSAMRFVAHAESSNLSEKLNVLFPCQYTKVKNCIYARKHFDI